MGYAKFVNNFGKATIFHLLWHVFEANWYFSFVENASEN